MTIHINMGALPTWEECDENADWIMNEAKRKKEMAIIEAARKKHEAKQNGLDRKTDQGAD